MADASTPLIACVIAAAAVLRAAMCGMYVFNDEYPIIGNVLTFLRDRTIVPSHFAYPTLFSYVATAPTVFGGLVLSWLGVIPSMADLGVPLTMDWLSGVLAARLTSCAFGLLTIGVVFDAGRRFYGEPVGTAAAALLTFSSLHVTYSAYALPDATMTFFAACAIRFSLAALEGGSTRDLMLAAAAVGLTASTKYNGALVALPVGYVLITRFADGAPLDRLRRLVSETVATGSIALAAFLVGSPGWLLAPRRFYEAFARESVHMQTGHLGFFGTPYVQQLTLAWEWEKTFAILVGASVLHAAWKRNRRNVLLLTVVVPAFVIIGSWSKQDLHYLLFAYPAAAILAGSYFVDVMRRGQGRHVVIRACFVVAVAAWPAYQCAVAAYAETKTDTRVIAAEWMQQNVPENARLVLEDEHSHLPRLFTASEKRQLTSGSHRAFFERQLASTRTYELIPLLYQTGWVEGVAADYLLIGSDTYARYFNTPPPPVGHPLYEDYRARRSTYAAILTDSGSNGWTLLQTFKTGKGPELRLYRRAPWLAERDEHARSEIRKCSESPLNGGRRRAGRVNAA